MSKEKLGQDGAFPQKNIKISEEHKGMSKRFYAACAAMQGFCTNTILAENIGAKGMAEKAYRYADELLKQENDKTG